MSSERRKVRVGTVIQDRMNKTVVVAIEWRRPHKLYRKPVRRRSRFYAHDEANQCRIGDQVRIIETRPLSKLKRWRVVEVLSSTDIAEIAPEEIDREVIEGTELPEPASEVEPTTLVQAAVVEGEEAVADEAEAQTDEAAPPAEETAAEAEPQEVASVETEEVAAEPETPVAEVEQEGVVAAESEATDDTEAEEKKETSE